MNGQETAAAERDADALDAIAEALASPSPWDAAMCQRIAAIVRQTGREVVEP